MRVLYVDTFSMPHSQAIVNGIKKAYSKVAEVRTFAYRAVARRLGKAGMNQALVETAQEFQPDLVHLGKSELILGSAIQQIKQTTRCCVIHFYGDFRWQVQLWVADIGQYADWTLLYHQDPGLVKAHEDAGCRRVGFWWYGTDPEVFYPRPVPKAHDVIFMGALDHPEGQGRRELVTALANAGFQVHVFGRNRARPEYPANAHLHGYVDEEQFALACSRAKIALGYSESRARMYTSWRRVFNSMASGVFFLTRYFEGLEDVFENEKHLAWFRTIPEAVELAGRYLRDDEGRERIAAAGLKETVARHTWDRRIKMMLEYAGLEGQ